MIFECRAETLEAQAVEFAGAKLMLVAVDGAAHVVPADAFLLLFQEKRVESAPVELPRYRALTKPVKKVAAPAPASAKKVATPSPATGATPDDGAMTTMQAVMSAVAEQPRTMAETQDRVCVILGWDLKNPKSRDRIYQNIWMALKNGKLEKRTDPATQLSRLFIKAAQ